MFIGVHSIIMIFDLCIPELCIIELCILEPCIFELCIGSRPLYTVEHLLQIAFLHSVYFRHQIGEIWLSELFISSPESPGGDYEL